MKSAITSRKSNCVKEVRDHQERYIKSLKSLMVTLDDGNVGFIDKHFLSEPDKLSSVDHRWKCL